MEKSSEDEPSRTASELTGEELARYEWQLNVPGFGVAGQQKLKNATVLISRAGGVGGLVAYQLAAAGVGNLIIAHAGNIKPSDLNRQLLMTTDALGSPRADSIVTRLSELNPNTQVEVVAQNLDDALAMKLSERADLIVDCAPLFPERFAMNAAAVARGIPMVECAMYELEAQLTTIIPGVSPCLRCFIPEAPPSWTRKFPVFGAVSGSVACLAAMEAIKLVSGIGNPLTGELLQYDLRDMTFRKLSIGRRSDCVCCGNL
ncbi:MAG: hypothetical protein Aurels2KO_09650 [Aureliella sp.]